jgi:8-oxo-dGTP pyrophosphatase MutT (NUDIX family)
MSEDSDKILAGEILHLLSDDSEMASEFRKRLGEGNVTRAENPATHFGVYFAAVDSDKKKVFMGSHKKSGLWLFNGGHLDEGENFRMAVEREIGEEWGLDASALQIEKPALLTIAAIENPKQLCKFHFDVWHFIDVDMDAFNPEAAKLAEETHETRWLDLEEAQWLSFADETHVGLDFIEKNYFLG